MLYSNGHDFGWMDKDFMSNNYKKDTYVSPLADDTAMPCDTCPLMNECAVSGKECVALRSWYNDGKEYKSEDVGRLLR
jgi:hypothetical protein